jgi:Ca-activated chloride channel family protein
MDEKELKKIMQGIDIPSANENAKKRALNLSLNAFKSTQKEKQKIRQGKSFLQRLMGSSNKNTRRKPMSAKLNYVGIGFAVTTVLVIGSAIMIPQFNQYKMRAPSDMVASSNGIKSQHNRNEGLNKNREQNLQVEESDRYLSSPAPSGQITASQPRRDNKPSESVQTEAKSMMEAKLDAPASVDRIEPLSKSGSVKAPETPMPITPKKEKGKSLGNKLAVQNEVRTTELSRNHSLNKPLPPTSSAFQDFSGSGSIISQELETKEAVGYRSKIILDKIPSDTYKDVGRDKFEKFEINPIKIVSQEPVSTFSIDVDTASYSFMRREIMRGVLPQKNAVRVEEMINYFKYDYPLPETKERPFKASVAVVPSPWKEGNKLMHIGIKGYEIDKNINPPKSNLVLLLDVSGSMNAPDKLPLMVNSLKLLLNSLQPDDTVGIVVYAGAAGTVLEPTAVKEKSKILAALNRLSAGGSTAGGQGIRLAYQMAQANFDKEAVNRVILATDGDFNVGITDQGELKGFIERKRKSGVFLSVLGFGQGNYNDSLMQALAQNGNGVAAYIDTLSEARKILSEEASSTLFPIAKDVKIQVEFNPATVAEYRLVGYETRALKKEDFNNDAIDAGDIGAGHTVTAIYEITPVDGPVSVDPSRYQKEEATKTESDFSNEYAFLKIRYKLPEQDTSTLITEPITTAKQEVSAMMKQETYWAIAVAGFGQLLKGGEFTGKLTYDDIIEQAQSAKGNDEFGYRSEFIQLTRLAKTTATQQ